MTEKATGAVYGHCPLCGFRGELHGDCEMATSDSLRPDYRERWICAREDPDSARYLDGMGCRTEWWEVFKYVGSYV